MLVKKSDLKEFKNSPDCTVWEYDFPSKLLSFATASIDGRYPEVKRVTNLECEELYYVISGSGVIHSNKGDFEISAGDLYHFAKGEIYWVEGKKLLIGLANSPKWTPEQLKVVE